MQHRCEKGYSSSGCGKLIGALRLWYCSLGSDFDLRANPRISILNKSLKTRWKQNGKVHRVPLMVSHIDTIIATHPKNANKKHWATFVVLAWVFLLRHGETIKAKPKHLSSYKDAKGEKRWALVIPEGKTSVGPNDPQHVFFLEDDIPFKYIPYLMWFSGKAKNEDFQWKVGKQEDHVKHVRIALGIPTSQGKEFCFHCTRHGRATWLTSMAGYTLADLMRVGRWKSKPGAQIYIHK